LQAESHLAALCPQIPAGIDFNRRALLFREKRHHLPKGIMKMKTYSAITIELLARPSTAKLGLACLVLSLVGICLPVTGWSQNQWEPKFATFDPSGSNGTFPTCVNERGLIAGQALTIGTSYNVFIRSRDGAYTTFALPGSGSGTAGFGINLEGSVAGSYLSSYFGGIYHGLLRTHDGTLTQIDVPGAGTGSYQGTTANNINAFGLIAGYYSDASSVSHGFVRSRDGKITTFDAPDQSMSEYHGVLLNTCGSLNDVGEVTGYYLGTDGIYHSFLRAADGQIASFEVPGSQGTFAAAINEFGVIAGYYMDSSQVSHGFLRFRNGTFRCFDAPGAGAVIDDGTFPSAINARGVVTGYYLDPSHVYHGFIRWPDGRQTSFEAPGAGSTSIEGTLPASINGWGEITGSYVATGIGETYVSHGFVLYP
jgi:hypothetical protein